MAWLSDWVKRIEITIDSTNIDSDLDHFPIPIVLGTSVGQDNDDVSCVFDELASDANRKKIAVTKDDGTTQLYVEIETWDDENEKAVLWVSKSDFTLPSGGTTLYLYYDSAQADNDTYVGDTGDSPAKDVWDDSFVGVWHLAQDPSVSNIKDSTSYVHDMSPNGVMTSEDLIDSTMGKAIDFDGSDDDLGISDTPSNDIKFQSTDFTLEVLLKADALPYSDIIGVHRGTGWQWSIYSSTQMVQISSTGVQYRSSDTYSIDTEYYLAAVYNLSDTSIDFYTNGVFDNNDNDFDATTGDSDTDKIYIAADSRDGSGNKFNGTMDELRISKTARPAAYFKTTRYALQDDLLTFGSEDLGFMGYFSGYVYEESESFPVSRSVYCYRRDTGELMNSTTSSGNGYYYLETTYSGYNFLVALDNDAGTQYNLAALDWMIPVTIS